MINQKGKVDVIIERGITYDERERARCLELLYRRGPRSRYRPKLPPRPSERPQLPGETSIAFPLNQSPSTLLHFLPAKQSVSCRLAVTQNTSNPTKPSTYLIPSSKSVKMVKAGKIASALLPRHCVKLCKKKKEGSLLPLSKWLFHAIWRTLMASFTHHEHRDGHQQPIMFMLKGQSTVHLKFKA